MNIIAADDEPFALSALTRVIKEALPHAVVHSFDEVSDLMLDVRGDGFCPDVAFLDIEMSDMNGLELARVLKTICPTVNIIFVTGFSQYALDAYKLRPSGYLTKPVTSEDILNEIQNLRCPPKRTQPDKAVFIRCFGNFEVIHQGEAISFPREKSKEILAYLVKRQGNVTNMKELADALWEDGIYDRSRQKQLAVLRHELIRTLEEHGISDILKVYRGALAVAAENFDCDYYMMLAGDNAVFNSFNGEFMNQYSWSEEIKASLAGKYLY